MVSSATSLLSVIAVLGSVVAIPAAPQQRGWDQYNQYNQGQDYQWQQQQQQGHQAQAVTLHETQTWAAQAYPTPSHGSGSMPPPQDLNSCLQVCHAQWPAPGGAPPPPAAGEAAGTPALVAGPATHTIIVAPTMGVLRFVPFSVNAKKGDKLEFLWGAGPHTATLSSGQNVCNKSETAGAFDSGNLNATATFQTEVTDDSKPQFHYCKVGAHCTNGMFGVINPPSTNVTNNLTQIATATIGGSGNGGRGDCSDDSMGCWVDKWSRTSPQASQTVAAVKQACAGTGAWDWGKNIDGSGWVNEVVSRQTVIENVMYTRLMMSMNPSMIGPGGSFTGVAPRSFVAAPDLNTFVSSSNVSVPEDILKDQQASAGASGAAGASDAGAPGAEESGGAATAAGASTGGAARMTIASTTLFAGVFVVFAALL